MSSQDKKNAGSGDNEVLLRKLLKEKWRFNGFVISFWASVQ